MNILVQISCGLFVLLAIHKGVVTAQNKIGFPCDPRAGSPFRPSNQCGPLLSFCNSDTRVCDCLSHNYSKNWMRTYQGGQCRLLPGSRCNSNPANWNHPDFERCVDNAKCVSNGPRDGYSVCTADAVCERGDGNCVCQPGKTCLNRSIPPPRH